jgi:hypothetical protein
MPAVRFGALWRSEKGLSAMLVFLCLALFVGAPLMATVRGGELLFDVLFSLLLLSGVVTVGRRPLLTAVVGLLTAVTLVLRWASVNAPESRMRVGGQALSFVLLSILAALVLVQVFREGPITSYRIQGAVVVYLLIGLAWTAAYELVHHQIPGAFHFPENGAAGGAHGLLYFSFVTLATLGYGDVTPVHPIARSFAIAEALLGQLYPAILIARLVSMQIASRPRD